MKVRNLPEAKLLEKFQLERDGASAGIIVTDDQRYLLQLRDTKRRFGTPIIGAALEAKLTQERIR